MQGWILVAVWAFALVFGAVVLGFAVYEVSWKIRRLQADRTRLEGVLRQLSDTTGQLQAASVRARSIRVASNKG
jgi:hypothetical protein